jgi:aminomuconate-semialdehyde/2-hydroxymuconate-6-semialdehyde dehydrogenase
MDKIKNYINGELVEPISGFYIDNIDPSRGKVYSLIPDSDERDVELAVIAAKAAFKEWSNTPKEKRARILQQISYLIEDNIDKLAFLESVDNGKPWQLAKTVDIPRAAANFNFYATGILHYAANTHSMEDTAINYTLRQPVGVAGCISVELTFVFIYLEDCSGFSGGLHSSGKTFGSNSDDCLLTL